MTAGIVGHLEVRNRPRFSYLFHHANGISSKRRLEFGDRETDSAIPLIREWRLLALKAMALGFTIQGLLAEANAVRLIAVRRSVAESDGTEGRGGNPARAFRSGPGGDLHRRVHGSSRMTGALGRLCGATVAPTGAGSYSYYEQTGDFLAIHRDVVGCDIAVITCLTASNPNVSAGGLLVYPRHIDRPLSEVRAAGRAAGVPVPLGAGDTVVLLGGAVRHEVTPLSSRQERIVAINCYRIFESGCPAALAANSR